MNTATAVMPANRSKEGMISLALGLFLFSFQDMVIKSFSGDYSVLQIVFVRSLIATVLLCIFATIVCGARVIIARQPGVLLLKGFVYFFAFTFYYMAFPMLPVADVVAVTFLAPIIVTLLSIVFLKEKVGIKLWFAVTTGFVGVLLVVGPEGKIYNIGAFFAFACALTYGAGSVITRYVTKGDPPVTIAIYSMFVITAMSGLCYLIVLALGLKTGINPSVDFLLRDWVWIEGMDGWLLVFIGCLASVGFYLHGRAYLLAPASQVTPFEYTYVFYTVFLAYIFFNEVPSPTTFAGLAILISSSLYIWYQTSHNQSQ
ncbi:MAG: DMT family transporter [Proteobacteria bacterium]|nr:DMT family transporter [Pseudomonadota bacterium]